MDSHNTYARGFFNDRNSDARGLLFLALKSLELISKMRDAPMEQTREFLEQAGTAGERFQAQMTGAVIFLKPKRFNCLKT